MTVCLSHVFFKVQKDLSMKLIKVPIVETVFNIGVSQNGGLKYYVAHFYYCIGVNNYFVLYDSKFQGDYY